MAILKRVTVPGDMNEQCHSRFWALAPAALPVLFVCVDTAAAWALGWRPRGMVEYAVLGMALGLLGLLAAALLLPTLHAWFSRWSKELWLLLAALAVSGSLLEAGADRLDRMLRPMKNFHTRGPNMNWIFTPVPEYLPGIEGPSHYTTDRQGIRQPGPPGDTAHRILCVGGSSTECVYLDDKETWPARLMQVFMERTKKPLWAGNVGISGYDTRDHLRFLESSHLLKGMEGVLLQIGINDLWRYLANEEVTTRYDRFSENGSMAEPVPRHRDLSEPWRPVWARSRVIQLMHTLRLPRPKPEMVEGAGGTEYKIRREKRAAAHITEQIPDLTRGLTEYRQRIQRIINVCRRRGLRVLFTTQPVLWRGDLPPRLAERCWFGWLENGDYLSLAALRECMDRYNDATVSVCREMHVPCADLSSMNGREDFFYDDCHFTERGAEEVARILQPMAAESIGAP